MLVFSIVLVAVFDDLSWAHHHASDWPVSCVVAVGRAESTANSGAQTLLTKQNYKHGLSGATLGSGSGIGH